MGNSQQIDKEKCYEIKVEFLTKSQKTKKDDILKDFEEVKLVDDIEVLVNKEDYYNVDFRQSIYVPKTLMEIDINYVMKHVDGNVEELTKDEFEYPEMTEFAKTQVKKILCLYVNNKITTDRKLKLNMAQCAYSTPIFEIVYERNSMLTAFSKKAAYTIKKIRKNFLKVIADLLGLTPLLNAVTSYQSGSKFGTLTSLCTKKMFSLLGTSVLGPNMYMGGFSLVLRLFFPFAAPLIALMRLGTG